MATVLLLSSRQSRVVDAMGWGADGRCRGCALVLLLSGRLHNGWGILLWRRLKADGAGVVRRRRGDDFGGTEALLFWRVELLTLLNGWRRNAYGVSLQNFKGITSRALSCVLSKATGAPHRPPVPLTTEWR